MRNETTEDEIITLWKKRSEDVQECVHTHGPDAENNSRPPMCKNYQSGSLNVVSLWAD